MSLQKRLFTLDMYQAAIDVHRMMSAVGGMVIGTVLYALPEIVVAEGDALDVVVEAHEGLGIRQREGLRIYAGVALEGVYEHYDDGHDVEYGYDREQDREEVLIPPAFAEAALHHCCTSFFLV